MKRMWLRALAALVTVALMAAAAWWFVRAPYRIAAESVTAYDLALSKAVRALDPELLGPVCAEGEKQRVASYITLLWGRGISLEATLRSLDVESAKRAEDGSLRATVVERWTYRDLDKESGRPAGEPRDETMRLVYTLEQSGAAWIVGRSELLEPSPALER